MIGKREILDIAGTLRLNPHIVEKDYVLGWVLAQIEVPAGYTATVDEAVIRERALRLPARRAA